MNKNQAIDTWNTLSAKQASRSAYHYRALAENYITCIRDTIQSIADVNGLTFDQVKEHILSMIMDQYKTKQTDRLQEVIRSRLKATQKPLTVTVTLSNKESIKPTQNPHTLSLDHIGGGGWNT